MINMEVVASLEYFARGHVFHVNTTSSVPTAKMSLKVLSSRHQAVQQKPPKFRHFLPFWPFPRHVSQQRAAGVNNVGAASRKEISIKTKNGAEGEGEYGDLKGMGLRWPEGWGRGPEVRDAGVYAVWAVGPQGMTELLGRASDRK